MIPDGPFDLENELAKAHLLIMRKDYNAAHKALDRLSRAGVPVTEIDPLRGKLRQQQAQDKEVAEGRRSWRYMLGLQTTTARIGWFIGALATVCYAIWNGKIAIQMGQAQGYATVITTQVYSRGQSHAWTRPIFVDVLYSAVLLVGAIVAMVVILKLSKDAAAWEELDVTTHYRR